MDNNIETELLSTIAFEDDILTQELAEYMDYTITFLTLCSPTTEETAFSSNDTANTSTEVTVSPKEEGRSCLLN